MKIAIVVHGRFHAFDFAKALIKRGHAVTVFTNYPRWATRKFGLPDNVVHGFWVHGVLCRIFHKLSYAGLRLDIAGMFNPMFGRWAAHQISKESYDVVHCFTGVAAELLEGRRRWRDPGEHPVHLIVRGSAHIAVQDELLHEEELRSKRRIERPSQTIIKREMREYQSADRIVVLSKFAYESFVAQGVARDRLALLLLGVSPNDFRASEGALQARNARISNGSPLRVLWVGTMSLRKGLLDYIEIVKTLAGRNFQFRFVGDIPADLRSMADEISGIVEFIPRQRQWALREQYDWGDVFILPTIEDGFAVVLSQAAVNGLPILTTTNCAGPDLIQENVTGWILPIRTPAAFIERLRWCDENREAVAAMVSRVSQEFVPRTWDDVARDFGEICNKTLQLSRKTTPNVGLTR